MVGDIIKEDKEQRRKSKFCGLLSYLSSDLDRLS